jgi:outer membrane protein assembly complex protein YaeT
VTKRLRRLALAAGALAGVILIGLAVLHLPSIRARVLDRARGYLEREFDIALGASSLSYNLFTRSIELRDLSLASTSAGHPFLRADRAVIVLGPGVFLGRPAVNRVSLSRPRLTVVKETDGAVNLPAAGTTGTGPRRPLRLGIVSVTALSVSLDDRIAQRSFTLGPLDLSVDTASASNRPGAFGPGAFTVRVGQIGTSGTIAGRLAYDGSRVRFEELTAQTREGRLEVTGWADVTGERPAVSARVNATVDLPQAARLARVDAPGLAGHLEGTVDVAGALADPTIVLAVTSRDASYAPIGPIRLSGRSSLGGGRVAIDALDVHSAAGSLHLQGGIELEDAPPGAANTPSRVALRWSDLRVDDLVQAFGGSSPVRSGSLASGSATATFDARAVGAGDWSRLRVAATSTLRPMANRFSSESLALSGTADLQVDEGRWSLRHSLETRRARADLTGTVTGLLDPGRGPRRGSRAGDPAGGLRSTLGGRSRLRVADVGAVVSLVQAAGVRVPADVLDGLTGSMSATVDLAGTTNSPRAHIDLAVRDVTARRLAHTGTLDARLDVDATGVRAHRLRASSGTTSLQASGRYSWRGPFEGRVALTQGELSEIASQFRLPVSVSGSARLEGTVSGSRQKGQAVLSLSARDLAVEQVAIGPLDATGRLTLVDGGLIAVETAAPNLGARARLEIVNRGGYPVSGEVTLEHGRIGALIPPRYQPQVGDVSGALSATARGSGLLSDPAGIRGRIDVRVLDATARGTRVVLAAPASVTLAKDHLAVDAVDLRIGQRTRATVDGQLGAVAASPEPLRLHIESALSELADIGSRAFGATPSPVRAEGTAALDLSVGGTFDHPLPTGSLAVRASSLEYRSLGPMTNLTIEAAIDPTLVTLRTLGVQWRGASFGGEGTLPWRVLVSPTRAPSEPSPLQLSRLARWLSALPAEPSRARLTVRADGVTQEALKDVLAPERLQSIQGNASATVVAGADRLSLERLHATAVLDRASLVLAGVPFVQTAPTRLRLENGRVSIDDFRWTAEGNSIVVTGRTDLTTARPSIDLGVSGVLDLRVAGAFLTGLASAGTAAVDLTATGSVADPEIVGRITVADGELRLDSPRVAASDLEGTLQVAPGRKVTVSVTGQVNTGSSRLEGTLDLVDLAAPRGNLQLTGRGVALEYPPGLQTESNLDLGLELASAGSMLSGRVEVLSGTYRETLVLTSQLLNLSSSSGIATAAPTSGWLSGLGLDVVVATATDLRIDNNYGRLDIGANLRLVGTPARPGVLGRLLAAEDGVIYLGGNTYRIERLVIDLTSPRDITPEVDFVAQTRVGDAPIRLELRCSAGGACERNVASLASGVDDKEAEARLFGTAADSASAPENMARLVSGELLGVVGRTVRLDTVRLEQGGGRGDIFDDPTLIAGDVDPAARLTLGKRLGSNVELVFSQNLADDGFTWITSYAGRYGLSGRLLVFDDQSRSYEFRHEPPIGGGRTRQAPRPPRPRIAGVTIDGTPGFPEKEVRRQLRLTEGRRFTFAEWQRDRDRLGRFYHAHGFLEARVRARRLPAPRAEGPAPNESTPRDDKVLLGYTITRGPATRLAVRGTTLPEAVRHRILERWTSAMFDGFLERDARTIVREHLYGEGYLNAAVTAAVAPDASKDVKTLQIDVVPGSIVPWRIEVSGNAALSTQQVRGLVSTPNAFAAWLDAGSVKRLVENRYRSEGFLAAEVSVGAPATVNGASVVAIAVVEGTPFSIGAITLSGLPAERRQDAPDSLALSSGERYRPALVAEGVDRLETSLRQMAYRQAGADVETRVDAEAARVDLAIRVTPGPRSILRDVVVEGDDGSRPVVARSIVLPRDAPLDSEAIRETRRRLYDLGVYRSVDIEVQPLEPGAAPPPAGATLEQPVVAQITLEERPRYRLRYGLAVSDEVVGTDERDQQLGFAADLENRNVFGRGATAGLSLRLRRDQRVGRVTFGAKRLFALPIRSTLFVERQRQQIDPEGAFPITSDISSLTAEQAYRIRPSIDLRYGYGIERNHTFIRSEETDAFDLTVQVARFTTSGLVDRRDDAFNPSRGWFAASTFEFSTPGIGSDLKFLKDFGQYLHFVPVGGGVVLASAVRVGLARTFGGEILIPTERFYAGGANSVRGYREDTLGEQSILGGPEGGSALLVLNAELRFPIYRWLKGVGFVDAGNVYPNVSDISFTDLRVGVGAGARLDTPLGLLRFDLGIPANRRPFDPSWRFHFGFGHVF